MSELLGDAPGDDEPAAVRERYTDPAVLSLVALILAVLVVCGFGLLSGTGLVSAAAGAFPTRSHAEEADVVSIVLAFLPLLLGLHAASRGLPDDARWVGVAARTAVVLALFAMVMRLGLLVIAVAHVPTPGGGLQFYNAP